MRALDTFIATTKALADPLRVDILRLLQRESFGVLELASVLEVPQPALSHHLKLLLEAGLVTKRRDGTSFYYRRTMPPRDGTLGSYLSSALATIDEPPLSAAQRTRIKKVHSERGERSRAFFRTHTAEFPRQQALICSPDVYLGAIDEVIDRNCETRRAALDVGVGDGGSLALLSPRFKRVVGIDEAAPMLERARQRVTNEGLANVTLRVADIASVRGSFDLVLMSMVVHHAASPRAFFRHARRLLSPRGVVLVVELCTHEQVWTKEACGDVWLGFEPEELDVWAQDEGLQPGDSEYLAQRNGFRIQIRVYRNLRARSARSTRDSTEHQSTLRENVA